MADFLLEIGLEEVPARMIAAAEAELGKRVTDLLKRERLVGENANVTTYSTPRRLAVLAEGVEAKQADNEKVVMGPSWKIAFNDGTPTPAAEAFAKKAGIAVTEIKKIETSKGEYVGATVKLIGRTAAEILVCRAAEGSAGALLGQEYVLARGQAGAVCAAGALGCGSAGCRSGSARDCRNCSGQREPRASGASRRSARRDRRREELRRYSPRGVRCGRCCRAPADHPQSSGRGNSKGRRSTLARRRSAGGNGDAPDRVADRDPRRV